MQNTQNRNWTYFLVVVVIFGTMMVCMSWSELARADRVRNGGNFDELEFTAIAYDLLDALTRAKRQTSLAVPMDLARLKSQLSVMTVKSGPRVEPIRGEPKHASNTPDLVLVDFETPRWKSAGVPSRQEMVMHELFPLVDILDEGYHKAIAQLRFLRAGGYLQRKVVSRKVTPELLLREHDDNTREGLSAESAKRICQQAKEAHDQTYFVVYCHVIRKTWKDWRENHQTTRRHSHWSERSGYRPEWREVIGDVVESRHEAGHVEDATYGIRVYGLGQVAKLPWRVIFSSQDFGDGMGSRLFQTRVQARDACRELIYRLDNGELRYYRATCRTSVRPEDGAYYYEVVSQNPLGKEGT